MSYRGVKTLLLACVGVGALIAATADANAGGFAVREQSAFGQGSSFAGVAAGGSLSSMFWNPATMTQVPGIQFESVLTGIMPYAANTPGTPSTFLGLGGTGDTANDALVPAAYFSWQFKPNMWLGLSVNSPFGLSVSFPGSWAGRDYAGNTSLKTYNATPSFAYEINNWLSIGIGVQVQYAKADLSTGLPTGGATDQLSLTGSGWGYGFTAGLTLTPTPTTTIGLGYRSAMNQKINGTLSLPAGAIYSPPFSTPGSASTTLNLPDVVSLGLRQRVGAQWTLLGTAEWTNWSRIGTSNVVQSNGAPALILNTFGGGAMTLPFQYRDGWFFSLGAEYQWNPQLALRGGIGFEQTPISDQVRTPRLPDNDRTWLSLGGTYRLTPKMSFDLAYSHLFVKSTSITISDTSNPWFIPALGTYTGTVDSHVDIISVALKYRWDNPAPAPVSKLYHK
jgi:long-chain fatty acid transport protein